MCGKLFHWFFSNLQNVKKSFWFGSVCLKKVIQRRKFSFPLHYTSYKSINKSFPLFNLNFCLVFKELPESEKRIQKTQKVEIKKKKTFSFSLVGKSQYTSNFRVRKGKRKTLNEENCFAQWKKAESGEREVREHKLSEMEKWEKKKSSKRQWKL